MDAATGTLVVTVILAVITAYYAWQTREMVKEMEKSRLLTERTLAESEKDRELTRQTIEEMQTARQMSLLPVLTCDLITATKSGTREESDGFSKMLPSAYTIYRHLRITLTNVGNAPALGTTLKIELENPETSGWKIRTQTWNLYTLAGGGYKREIPAVVISAGAFMGGTENPKLRVFLTYNNSYDRHFVTSILFETGIWKFIKDEPLLSSQEVEWTKLDEVSRPEP